MYIPPECYRHITKIYSSIPNKIQIIPHLEMERERERDGVCRMCGAWRVERWEWLWKSYSFNTVYSRQT